MKKLFLLCLVFVLISIPCYAADNSKINQMFERPTVAVVIAGSHDISTKELKQFIYEKFQANFTEDRYQLIIGEPSQSKVRSYVERHRLIDFTYNDILNFGKENRYDFVIYSRFETTNLDVGSGAVSVSLKKDIQLRSRIVDIQNESQIYDKLIDSRGTSSSVPILFGGTPSSEKALKEAIEKALAEFFSEAKIPLKLKQ